jgi:hypothetical protein
VTDVTDIKCIRDIVHFSNVAASKVVLDITITSHSPRTPGHRRHHRHHNHYGHERLEYENPGVRLCPVSHSAVSDSALCLYRVQSDSALRLKEQSLTLSYPPQRRVIIFSLPHSAETDSDLSPAAQSQQNFFSPPKRRV